MNRKLAIDIALLPSAEAMDELIKINDDLLAKFPSGLKLNKVDCLPHVTLAQAGIDDTELPLAKQILDGLAQSLRGLELSGGIGQFSADIAAVLLKPTRDLHDLHDKIMLDFEDIVDYDVQPENFSDKSVPFSTVEYTRDFYKLYAYDNYDPHITLGHGRLQEEYPDVSFTINRLAICRLGKYNTCTGILHEIALN